MANYISKFEKESLCKKTDLVNNNKPLTLYYDSRLKHHTHNRIVYHNSFKVRSSKASPWRWGYFSMLIANVIDNHHGTAFHYFRYSYSTLVKLSSTF